MRQPIVFGKYLLLERISVGGMAEVFKAKSFGEEGFQKILAIKRILPSMAEDEDFVKMFVDEAKISGQLFHPNIGKIFEFGRIDKSYFIAMEYVWGKDTLQIQNRVRRRREIMSPQMAAYIAIRVCAGLDYAHRKRDDTDAHLAIIHRDVSPQNVLVGFSGEVKLIDFGIAKARSRSSKTQHGVLKGKFGYMSPEQVRALPLDRRSDVFSIGTILHEMVTGERLFTGESDFATLEKVRNAIVTRPTKINPKVPLELEQIIMKALHRESNARYQWATEMQDDLTAFLMHQEPTFGVKDVVDMMTDLFDAEHKREQAALERYERLSAHDLQRLKDNQSAGAEGREAAISMLPQGAPSDPDGLLLPLWSDKGPAELRAAGGDPGAQHLTDDDLIPLEDGDGRGAARRVPVDHDEKTEVFDEALAFGAALEEGAPGEPTFIFNVQSGQMMPVAEQKTMILGQGGHNGGARAADADDTIPQHSPTVVFDSVSQHPVRPPSGTAEISATMPVMLDAKRPTMVKDVLISVLVAVVVLLGGGIFWLVKGNQIETRHATLVVSIKPPQNAQLFVGGELKGEIKAGTPLMVEGLAARALRVSVRTESGATGEEQVTLAAGQVRVVNLSVPMHRKRSHVALKIEPDGEKRVLLDGVEVASEAIQAPLEVEPGVDHEIRVEMAGFLTETVNFRVTAGDRIDRTITLKPGVITGLRITSVPAGAAVMVDETERGETPLSVDGIDPGRHKITVSLGGYKSKRSTVRVKAGAVTSFEATLEKLTAEVPATVDERPATKTTRGQDAQGAAHSGGKTTKGNGDPPVKPEVAKVEGADAVSTTDMGYLVANTIPWAKVFVDGKDTGKATPVDPRAKIPLPPGRHVVTFEADGKRFNYKIRVRAGQTVKLIKSLPVD